MSNAIFPTFIGRAYDNGNIPTYDTLTQEAQSGRTIRIIGRTQPKRTFSITLEWLSFVDKRTLDDFFDARLGGYDDFLFDHYDDDLIDTTVPKKFATADGVSLVYQLPYLQFKASPTLTIYDNGVSGSPAIGSTGTVTYGVAPTAGHTLSWSGGYYYRVHFADDKLDYTQVWSKGWSAKISLEEILTGATIGN